jgi:hypothetical protein
MTSPGSAEQVTVSLRCDEAGSAAAVAGHVTLAMAIRAGLPPLTADRARGNLATALAEHAPVMAPSQLELRFVRAGLRSV